MNAPAAVGACGAASGSPRSAEADPPVWPVFATQNAAREGEERHGVRVYDELPIARPRPRPNHQRRPPWLRWARRDLARARAALQYHEARHHASRLCPGSLGAADLDVRPQGLHEVKATPSAGGPGRGRSAPAGREGAGTRRDLGALSPSPRRRTRRPHPGDEQRRIRRCPPRISRGPAVILPNNSVPRTFKQARMIGAGWRRWGFASACLQLPERPSSAMATARSVAERYGSHR